MKGYCLKCRAHVDVIDAGIAHGGNIAKRTYKGSCPNCGQIIYRISNLDKTQDTGAKEDR